MQSQIVFPPRQGVPSKQDGEEQHCDGNAMGFAAKHKMSEMKVYLGEKAKAPSSRNDITHSYYMGKKFTVQVISVLKARRVQIYAKESEALNQASHMCRPCSSSPAAQSCGICGYSTCEDCSGDNMLFCYRCRVLRCVRCHFSGQHWFKPGNTAQETILGEIMRRAEEHEEEEVAKFSAKVEAIKVTKELVWKKERACDHRQDSQDGEIRDSAAHEPALASTEDHQNEQNDKRDGEIEDPAAHETGQQAAREEREEAGKQEKSSKERKISITRRPTPSTWGWALLIQAVVESTKAKLQKLQEAQGWKIPRAQNCYHCEEYLGEDIVLCNVPACKVQVHQDCLQQHHDECAFDGKHVHSFRRLQQMDSQEDRRCPGCDEPADPDALSGLCVDCRSVGLMADAEGRVSTTAWQKEESTEGQNLSDLFADTPQEEEEALPNDPCYHCGESIGSDVIWYASRQCRARMQIRCVDAHWSEESFAPWHSRQPTAGLERLSIGDQGQNTTANAQNSDAEDAELQKENTCYHCGEEVREDKVQCDSQQCGKWMHKGCVLQHWSTEAYAPRHATKLNHKCVSPSEEEDKGGEVKRMNERDANIHKSQRKRKMIIIGLTLCKCPRQQSGEGCDAGQHEAVMMMPPQRQQAVQPPEWAQSLARVLQVGPFTDYNAAVPPHPTPSAPQATTASGAGQQPNPTDQLCTCRCMCQRITSEVYACRLCCQRVCGRCYVRPTGECHRCSVWPPAALQGYANAGPQVASDQQGRLQEQQQQQQQPQQLQPYDPDVLSPATSGDLPLQLATQTEQTDAISIGDSSVRNLSSTVASSGEHTFARGSTSSGELPGPNEPAAGEEGGAPFRFNPDAIPFIPTPQGVAQAVRDGTMGPLRSGNTVEDARPQSTRTTDSENLPARTQAAALSSTEGCAPGETQTLKELARAIIHSMQRNDPWETGATATPTPTDNWRRGQQKLFAPPGLVAPPSTPEGDTTEAREAREEAERTYVDNAGDAAYTILGIGLYGLPAINPNQQRTPPSSPSESPPSTVGGDFIGPSEDEGANLQEQQQEDGTESMAVQIGSSQDLSLTTSIPGSPTSRTITRRESHQQVPPEEDNEDPLMLRCSCKCECGKAASKLNMCPTCNNVVCYEECWEHRACHWCSWYPEDAEEACPVCGDDYPQSGRQCQRCAKPLCQACESAEDMEMCPKCFSWLIAEMDAGGVYENCPICNNSLEQGTKERCLKCHAAMCGECDSNQTFCIRCASNRPANGRDTEREQDGEEQMEEGESDIAPEEPVDAQYSHCSHCGQPYPEDEWGSVGTCPIERLSMGKRCSIGMMHTHCIQVHMMEQHPTLECPVRYRQSQQAQQDRPRGSAGESSEVRTTATLIMELPSCSHCHQQFPADQWIATSRCPVAEESGQEACRAEHLHRYCVRAHMEECHPGRYLLEEFREVSQQQIQQDEAEEEEQETAVFPDMALCSHCRVFEMQDQWLPVSLCPVEREHGSSRCNAGMLHHHCIQAHYETNHPQQDCPAEFRRPRRPRAWLPYADSALEPRIERCRLHANACTEATCPWQNPREGARCVCGTLRVYPEKWCQVCGSVMCQTCDAANDNKCQRCINISSTWQLPPVPTRPPPPSCTNCRRQLPRDTARCAVCSTPICSGCNPSWATTCRQCHSRACDTQRAAVQPRTEVPSAGEAPTTPTCCRYCKSSISENERRCERCGGQLCPNCNPTGTNTCNTCRDVEPPQEARRPWCPYCSRPYTTLPRRCRYCSQYLCADCEYKPSYSCLECQRKQEPRRRSLMESGEASSSGEPLPTRPDDGSWTPFAAADGPMERGKKRKKRESPRSQ